MVISLKRMKTLFLSIILVLMILPSSVLAAEETPIKVYIDGQQIYFADNPIIENGVTLVQFRPIFEKLGLTIGWDQETNTISGTKDGLEIKLIIGQTSASLNGKNIALEFAPKIVNGNSFIPLRFVGESSGKEVKWDGESKTVQIIKQNVLFNLSDSQIQDAIKVGEKGLDSLLGYKKNNNLSVKDSNLSKWTPEIWASTPSVQIARDSYLKNRDYKKYTIEDAKKTISKIDSMTFEFWTYGDEINFGENMNVVLKQGDNIIQPKEIIGKDDLGDTTSSWPKSPAYMKIVLVDFDKNKIDFNSEYELIYLYAGKELSATYKLKFSSLK